MAKLPKAPLKEVIFEIRWDLEVDKNTNMETDSGLEMAAGQLRGLLKETFPEYVRKVDAVFPIGLFKYQPIHQFWKSEKEWPVIQLGPGILTVNSTEKDYEWGIYADNIKKAVDYLIDAYEGNLSFNMISLRYLDSVKVSGYDFKDWHTFLDNNLNFNIQNNFESNGRLARFHCEQVFDIAEGQLHVAVSSGKSDEEDALVWQSAVYKVGSLQREELSEWIDSAHTVNSNLFRNFTKAPFYASFT